MSSKKLYKGTHRCKLVDVETGQEFGEVEVDVLDIEWTEKQSLPDPESEYYRNVYCYAQKAKTDLKLNKEKYKTPEEIKKEQWEKEWEEFEADINEWDKSDAYEREKKSNILE